MGCCNCAGYHDSDIGYWVNWIKEFQQSQANDFQIALENYMEQFFNQVMINAIYDEASETITLRREGA